MPGLNDRSQELMRMADHLDDMAKLFGDAWNEFQCDFFDLLEKGGYRPAVIALTGKKPHYFLIDYGQRRLIERAKPQVICEIELLDRFGKRIAEETDEDVEANDTTSQEQSHERTEDNYAVE